MQLKCNSGGVGRDVCDVRMECPWGCGVLNWIATELEIRRWRRLASSLNQKEEIENEIFTNFPFSHSFSDISTSCIESCRIVIKRWSTVWIPPQPTRIPAIWSSPPPAYWHMRNWSICLVCGAWKETGIRTRKNWIRILPNLVPLNSKPAESIILPQKVRLLCFEKDFYDEWSQLKCKNIIKKT